MCRRKNVAIRTLYTNCILNLKIRDEFLCLQVLCFLSRSLFSLRISWVLFCTKIGKYRLFCSLFGLHVTFSSVAHANLKHGVESIYRKAAFILSQYIRFCEASKCAHIQLSIVSATCIHLSQWATIVHCIYQRNKRSIALKKIIASKLQKTVSPCNGKLVLFFVLIVANVAIKIDLPEHWLFKSEKKCRYVLSEDMCMCLHFSICLAPKTTFQSIEKHI